MNCCSCGGTDISHTLACGHSLCRSCFTTLCISQQQHAGLDMHQLDIQCPAEGCDQLLFARSDRLPLQDSATVHTYLPMEAEPFANFYPSSFAVNGKTYPSVEHFYQSQKFANNPTLQEAIRQARTYRDAHILGHTGQGIRTDWDNGGVKEDVVLQGLRAKFGQNPGLKAKLLDTHPKILVQADTDLVWGANDMMGVVQGLNRHGELLQQVREELRNSA
eukprot:TRINITY_DN75566_c0_g1_i1.p1 TRINITY_DN75566_c0_g1~~TRINITY_DN75566_c0_g1_i1.p1  ORF type:complete len:219 (+),score=26.89 TRINITY_DN75566_c0_g1_i1:69-725(+)